MSSPFRFRPDSQEDVDGDGKVVEDWEDNPISNTMAWTSATFVPDWCQTEEHWTSRFVNYVFTTCPCCMFWRGFFLGGSMVLWLAIITAVIVIWLKS
jgi:hypothetical protein